MDIAAGLLKKISCEFAKTFVVETLANSEVQENFTRHLIESAMGRKISGDECIRLDDGRWIKMENVLKYRYFHRAIEKVKSSPSSLSYFLAHTLRKYSPISDHPKCDDLVVA